MTKRFFTVLFIAILAITCIYAQSIHEQKLYTGKTVIIHTNDVHGAIAGYAKVAALKADFEAQDANVILIDNGDFSQGTKYVSNSKGLAAVQLMNLAGYDISGIGNHEFDYGFDQLEENLKHADFKVLCANIYNADGKVIDDDYVIFTTLKGAQIGFFALDTPESQTKVNPTRIKGLSFAAGEEMYAVAQRIIDELREQGVETVICIGHLGISESSAPNRSIDLMANTTGIDFFIDGHSHSITTEIDSYDIQQTGTQFQNIGIIIIDDKTGKIVENYLIGCDGLREDAEVLAAANEIIADIDSVYGVVFAKSEVELNGEKAPGNRTMETNSGDLVSDCMIWAITNDPSGLTVPLENVVAINNGGGIRAWIHAGDITKNDVNTMLPFGSTITVVYVTGNELLEALEASTFSTPDSVGGFPQIAGMNITIDTTKKYNANAETYPASTYYGPASIERVTINDVNGKEFDPDATYAVVTPDFCAAGGDTYYAFVNASSQFDTGLPIDEVLIDYITEVLGGVIDAKYAEPQGRITIIQ
ncbi:MAG: 5'-nucleotidase C-terminal domain-containing protein [Spirochaetales bacterium]|nr:5'-nucleotidase C-terminal domain-containing protein [Spirochaetales bacterium]